MGINQICPKHFRGINSLLPWYISIVFGENGNDQWLWYSSDEFETKNENVKITLADLTGFEGRCDVILITKSRKFTPPQLDYNHLAII
ncbi:MAG: hypothetical protein KTR26_18130 [Flammeovirgaceae bacterium]|nr:hypothetical protein [Flammeovirgaceae bacterium]